MGEIAQRHVAQAAGQSRVLVDQSLGGPARIAHDNDIADGFRRKDPVGDVTEAKTIAGEAEFGDMAASVGQELADPHRAGNHLVPTVRCITFGVRFLASRREAAASADPSSAIRVSSWPEPGQRVRQLEKPVG